MAILKMSPAGYAKHISLIGGFTYNNKQAVQYRINKDKFLVGVTCREEIQGRWVLTIDTQLLTKQRKKSLKKAA